LLGEKVMPVGESAAQPGVPAHDDPAGGPDALDAPAQDATADGAVDEALRELLAETRAEDPYEPPVVFMSWYRRVSGLL
jgi:hypothetical protein